MGLLQSLSAGLIPLLIFVICGFLFRIGLPRKVNWWAGYRTSFACKNQETWAFAHRYVGKLWIVLGFILLALFIVAMVVIERGSSTLEPLVVLPVTVVAVIVTIIITIILTEIALRKEFDKNGERKNK